jgi:hypothetical protein
MGGGHQINTVKKLFSFAIAMVATMIFGGMTRVSAQPILGARSVGWYISRDVGKWLNME